MSLLKSVQSDANITHINLNDDDQDAGIKVTNTILNYVNSYTIDCNFKQFYLKKHF